ncbi:MAG: hypothetical protein PHY47_00905 [Lachnospiraceae bacterium]|nr:hypothetical protein [Lachnospiraceae bacterium]
MKFFIILLMFVILSSCGSIPQDPTMPPMDGNLRTLEMASCGKRDVGILGCETNLDDGILEIPVLYAGEIHIRSDNCNFFENKRYGGTQVLTYYHKDLIANKPSTEKSCIYDIKVFISGYDKGLRGEFFLSDKEFRYPEFKIFSQSFEGLGWIQVKEGTDLVNSISFKVADPGIIFWECGQRKGEKSYEANPQISFEEIFKAYIFEKDSCYLNVGIIPNDPKKEVMMAKIAVNVFDKSITSLSEPTFEFKKGIRKYSLKVIADPYTAGIQVKNKFKITKGTKVKTFKIRVNKNEEVPVRIITAGGRYLLLKVKNGEVIWKNYIKY